MQKEILKKIINMKIFGKKSEKFTWLENLGDAWQSDWGRLVICEQEWFTIFGRKFWKLKETNTPQTKDFIHYTEMADNAHGIYYTDKQKESLRK
jgi:hypothetical protein